MRRTQMSAAVAFAAMVTSPSFGLDNGLLFNFPNGNVYTGAKPVVIEVWAKYKPSQYIAWAGWTGAVIGDTTGAFSSPLLANPVPPPGTSPGTPGMNVTGIVAGQLHFPPLFSAKTDNPIKIFSVEWSTNDLTKRLVDIQTATTKYSVYLNSLGNSLNLAPGQHFAQIRVVPVPSSVVAILAFCSITATRRRARGPHRLPPLPRPDRPGCDVLSRL